ncbi:MAG: hypothetical protein R3C19_12095 [Planctomycetaceae bacterium]
MSDDNTNNKPVHRIRIGRISAAVFENATRDGQTFFNVQFDRAYREGDDWKHTKSFGRDDLLVLAKVCDQTHSWIVDQKRAEPEPGPEPG